MSGAAGLSERGHGRGHPGQEGFGDFAVQAIVCKRIGEVFPEDSIIAEETADELRKPEMADLLSRVVIAVHTVEPDWFQQTPPAMRASHVAAPDHFSWPKQTHQPQLPPDPTSPA